MSLAYGYGYGLQFGRGRGAPAVPAWQQILTLAEADGWTAVYDPTNPNTRTLRTSGSDEFIAALADGLGNLPDLVQATEAQQPQLAVGAFGKLDAAVYAGSGQRMSTDLFPQHSQPNFQIIVLRDDRTGSDSGSATHGVESGGRNSVFTTGAGRMLSLATSTVQSSSILLNNDKVVVAGLFNGASSVAYKNKGISETLDTGTEGMTGLRIGNNVANNAPWNGNISVSLLFDGAPSDAVRNRMFDLLHDLTGIAKA